MCFLQQQQNVSLLNLNPVSCIGATHSHCFISLPDMHPKYQSCQFRNLSSFSGAMHHFWIYHRIWDINKSHMGSAPEESMHTMERFFSTSIPWIFGIFSFPYWLNIIVFIRFRFFLSLLSELPVLRTALNNLFPISKRGFWILFQFNLPIIQVDFYFSLFNIETKINLNLDVLSGWLSESRFCGE